MVSVSWTESGLKRVSPMWDKTVIVHTGLTWICSFGHKYKAQMPSVIIIQVYIFQMCCINICVKSLHFHDTYSPTRSSIPTFNCQFTVPYGFQLMCGTKLHIADAISSSITLVSDNSLDAAMWLNSCCKDQLTAIRHALAKINIYWSNMSKQYYKERKLLKNLHNIFNIKP